MASDNDAVRAARNESIFRVLNEHLEASSTATMGDSLSFVSECADMGCAEVLTVDVEEYAAVRADPQRFIVAPSLSHVSVDLERIVDRHDGYWVVEKFGLAGDVAEKIDENP